MHFTEIFLQPKTHHWNLHLPSNTPARSSMVEILQLGFIYGNKNNTYWTLNISHKTKVQKWLTSVLKQNQDWNSDFPSPVYSSFYEANSYKLTAWARMLDYHLTRKEREMTGCGPSECGNPLQTHCMHLGRNLPSSLSSDRNDIMGIQPVKLHRTLCLEGPHVWFNVAILKLFFF